jgi:hypothetical protein
VNLVLAGGGTVVAGEDNSYPFQVSVLKIVILQKAHNLHEEQ